ncbi:nascent polypeptide-associated complex subunit family protein [Rhodotorula paludigena]|uniref:Nascent polypeptide-associated complex subunit beta n=1 Tax=Rhodotorula paludigena TaxID=86838 RepID=A0AAV5GS89_9BASI|nr:hypothetical protein Rhopal_006148-T1 [Rhodotorula paludigena]
MADSAFDPAKLAQLQKKAAALKIGGGGAKAPIRRKVQPRAAAPQDDSKLRNALKKLNVQSVGTVEEVNMFTETGGALHFTRPTVHAAAGNNTYAIYGHGVNKDLAEMMPNVLSQLGPDALATLRQIAEQYQRQQAQAGGAADEAGEPDDEVPELVEAAEPAKEEGKLEDLN